jgi:hypothetical protein
VSETDGETASERERESKTESEIASNYIYTYIYIYRERERESVCERERERERDNAQEVGGHLGDRHGRRGDDTHELPVACGHIHFTTQFCFATSISCVCISG